MMVLGAITLPSSLLSRPLRPISHPCAAPADECFIANRAFERGIGRTNDVQQNAQRNIQWISKEHHSDKPHRSPQGTPFVKMPESRDDAQQGRDSWIEPRVTHEDSHARQRRAAVLAELCPGNDYRLAASPTI